MVLHRCQGRYKSTRGRAHCCHEHQRPKYCVIRGHYSAGFDVGCKFSRRGNSGGQFPENQHRQLLYLAFHVVWHHGSGRARDIYPEFLPRAAHYRRRKPRREEIQRRGHKSHGQRQRCNGCCRFFGCCGDRGERAGQIYSPKSTAITRPRVFGGVGIKLQLGGLTQTRIIGFYMDYTSIVAEDPVQLDITNSFFLGDATIVLKSSQRKIISGVNIVDNMFSGSQKGVDIVQLVGRFESIDQTVVDRNNVGGMALKSTVARATVQGNGTKWTIDFNRFLLFPNLIQHVQYSFYTSDASFPRHALRNVSHNKVVIEAETQVSATVAVQVDQSATFVQGDEIYS